MSEAYCQRCLNEGFEAWYVIVATVAACTLGYEQPPEDWRTALAPWAVEIIDRSLIFHQKTSQDLIAAVQALDTA
jgi:hypothetical protein